MEIHFQLIRKVENGNPDSIKIMGPVLCGLALRRCLVKDKDNVPESKVFKRLMPTEAMRPRSGQRGVGPNEDGICGQNTDR